jgi:mono/diheme cytochrome c family protein
MSITGQTASRNWRMTLMAAAAVALSTAMVAALGLPAPAHAGQQTARDDGAVLYKTYCATCHGVDATGNGPLARALRHAPTDLTELARHNGGLFPSARVHRIVEGRDVESHGDRDMPVWGDAFAATRDGRSAAAADARIAAIIRYLEAIQHRDAQ